MPADDESTLAPSGSGDSATLLGTTSGAVDPIAATSPGDPDATHPDPATSRASGPAIPGAGDRIGHFVVQRKLGAGAMGVVLLALDEELERTVAIKLLTSGVHGPVAQARLLREARSGARLQHPNVVAVHQVGTHDGQVYLVMEHVAGGTLRQWRDAAPRTWREILDVFVQAGRGLAAAHAAGMVHRDFKPDNVLIDETGRARVSDFGLVDAGEERSELSTTGERSIDERLTQTGAIMGTPAYMAPEQMGGDTVDARSDQYAFCVALYEALWGKRPFDGKTLAALVGARAEGPPAPPRSEVPTRVADAVLRGMAYEASDRFADMDALLRALQPGRSRWPAVGVAIGVAALTITASVMAGDRTAEFTCPGTNTILGEAWDRKTRAVAEQAFRASGDPEAERTWAHVAEDLDARRAGLEAALADACADAEARDETRGTFAPRSSCLTRHARELSRIGEAMTRIDEHTLDGAQIVAREVAGQGRCDDPARVAAEGMDVAPEHAEAHRDVVTLELTNAAERHAKAVADGEALVIRLRELEAPGLLARALLAQARARTHSQDLEAIPMLREAMKLAASGDDHALEAEAIAVLVGFETALYRDQAESLALVPAAATAAERAADPRARARSLVAAAMGKMVELRAHEESLARWTEAIETLEATPHSRPDELSGAYFFRGTLRAATGQDGSADQEQAERLLETWLGPQHPALARLLFYRALAATMAPTAEAFAATRDDLDRARAIWEATLGPDARVTIGAVVQVGRAQYHTGDAEGSVQTHAEALRRCDRGGQCDPGVSAVILENLAWEEVETDRLDDAIGHYRRAEDIARDPLHRASIVLRLGDTQLRAGRADEAVKEFARLRELAVEQHGPKHDDVLQASYLLGHATRRQGDCEGALEHYRRALRLQSDLGRTPDEHLRETLVGLGRCELALGRWQSARESLDGAHGLPQSAERVYIDAELDLGRAILLHREGDRAGARALVVAARDALREASFPHAPWIAELDAWLSEHRTE